MDKNFYIVNLWKLKSAKLRKQHWRRTVSYKAVVVWLATIPRYHIIIARTYLRMPAPNKIIISGKTHALMNIK